MCNFTVHDRCISQVVTPCSSIAPSLIKVNILITFFNIILHNDSYRSWLATNTCCVGFVLFLNKNNMLWCVFRTRWHTVGLSRDIINENFAQCVGSVLMRQHPYIAWVSRIVNSECLFSLYPPVKHSFANWGILGW